MKNKQNVCPVTNALTILGGKWKINIIFQLSQNTMRFGGLRRSLGDVTQQMLTKQLREMERDKLINRKVYDVVPPKVEYSLTDLGRSSLPILKSLHHWGNIKKRTINKKLNTIIISKIILGKGTKNLKKISDLANSAPNIFILFKKNLLFLY